MPLIIQILNAVADLLLNLAAGWFALVFVVPFTSQQVGKRQNLFILLAHVFFGIMATTIAIYIRQLIT